MKSLLKRLPYVVMAVVFLLSVEPLHTEDTEEPPPVADTIERLYQEYDEIDRKIRKLKEDLEGQNHSTLLTPFTVTVRKDRGFTLLGVELVVDGRYVSSHLYSATENTALEEGGRHLLYNSTLRKDTHRVFITYRYRTSHTIREETTGWTVNLQDEPFILEIFFKKTDKEDVTPVAVRVHLVDEDIQLEKP